MVPHYDHEMASIWLEVVEKWMVEAIHPSIHLYPRLLCPVLKKWWTLPSLISIYIADDAALWWWWWLWFWLDWERLEVMGIDLRQNPHPNWCSIPPQLVAEPYSSGYSLCYSAVLRRVGIMGVGDICLAPQVPIPCIINWCQWGLVAIDDVWYLSSTASLGMYYPINSILVVRWFVGT